mmetsp:Transcript_27766/g.51712  ORF Transcript_27766/g.51712 Transcript_27766/m.51712 type:complete len:252 (+) Transcript_27766:1775-2530(+)
MAEVEAKAVQDDLKIIHNPPGLRLDPVGKRRVRSIRVRRHLPGKDHPAVRFHRMGERRNGAGAVGEEVKARHLVARLPKSFHASASQKPRPMRWVLLAASTSTKESSATTLRAAKAHLNLCFGSCGRNKIPGICNTGPNQDDHNPVESCALQFSLKSGQKGFADRSDTLANDPPGPTMVSKHQDPNLTSNTISCRRACAVIAAPCHGDLAGAHVQKAAGDPTAKVKGLLATTLAFLLCNSGYSDDHKQNYK